MPTTKREWARHFASKGLPVFPVVENTKRARIKDWPNLATTDLAQIDAWWEEWPHDNIGFYTNEFIVIDVDPRKGGLESIAALGMVEDFPKTARHRTQGDGAHIIYAAPGGRPLKGGNDKLGQGLDIKARGGYILLPGSEIDGRGYFAMNESLINLAPPWLVDRCNAARVKTDAAGKRIVEEDDMARELFEQWMLGHAPIAETGNIDNTTYKVAARGYDFACAQATVMDVLLEWNETKCFPPQDIEDLERVVESAGRNRENAIGSAHPLAPGFEAVEIAERPAEKHAIPVEGMQIERYFAAAAKALSAQAEPLIKGILDRGAMSILYGESNTGKTFIAVDMAFHIAAALAWAKRKVRGGAVVYVAAEGGAGVYKRLAALREHYPKVDDIPLFIIKFPVDLLRSKEHAAALVKLCRQAATEAGQVLELIVIDTLSRAMSGGDENSSTDMGGIVKSFDAIREVTGAHLMVIHHSGKDRAKGARGHSLLRAATDTEIEVERGKLAVTKQRDMDGEFKQGFSLRTVPIGLDADGGVVTSCIVELTEPGASGQVVVPLTKTQATIVKALKAWLGENDKHRSFGWKDARTAISDADSDAAVGASTLKEHLKAISDAGHSRKVSENTYVFD